MLYPTSLHQELSLTGHASLSLLPSCIGKSKLHLVPTMAVRLVCNASTERISENMGAVQTNSNRFYYFTLPCKHNSVNALLNSPQRVTTIPDGISREYPAPKINHVAQQSLILLYSLLHVLGSWGILKL